MLTNYQTHRLNHTYARATKGVSYAMPAYYADRLCERGRCYIRNSLVPSRADRDEQDTKRRDLEDQKRAARHRPQKSDAEKKKRQSKKEAEEDKEDKKAVERILRDDLMVKIRKRFDGTPNRVIPQQVEQRRQEMLNKLSQTMWWM